MSVATVATRKEGFCAGVIDVDAHDDFDRSVLARISSESAATVATVVTLLSGVATSKFSINASSASSTGFSDIA
jgi:hypothetical protein